MKRHICFWYFLVDLFYPLSVKEILGWTDSLKRFLSAAMDSFVNESLSCPSSWR